MQNIDEMFLKEKYDISERGKTLMFEKVFPLMNGPDSSRTREGRNRNEESSCSFVMIEGENTPLIEKLRNYRDMTLQNSLSGRAVIMTYYQLISPALAWTLRVCPPLKQPYKEALYHIANWV